MDETSRRSKEQFLGDLDIFSELEEEELAALALIAEEYEFDDKAVIAYQRDVADEMIIVRDGRLYAYRVDSLGVVRDSRSYEKEDYFEDAWLFTPSTHQATVKGSDNGRLIFIREERFLQFLKQNKNVLERLHLSEEGLHSAEGSTFAKPRRQIMSLDLLPEEIIEYYSRRSGWLLMVKLIWPVLLLVIVIAAISTVIGYGSSVGLVLVVIPVLLTILFLLYQTLDWVNDYFVITNKHIIHHENDLRRFQATVNKTPLDQVQSVEVIKPGLLATILNTGTARVTTAAQSGIMLFDYIGNPYEVEQIINRLREGVQAMDAGRAQATMRASIEQHFQATPGYNPVEEDTADGEVEELSATPISGLASLRSKIWHAMGSRVVEGNIITYRKHVFTLLTRTWWQILAGTLLFAGMVLVESIVIAVICLILWLASIAFFIWRFEDWRNDTFQVTDRYVIDIDRQPFGFGESRKQAELGNVQNVNSERPGIIATIFNFGFVYIETAGATADITFERVAHPNRVQSDIFGRREAFKHKQRVREGEARRKEYAVLLDVYQQAREQDRIPTRTPTNDFDSDLDDLEDESASI